MKAKVSKKEVKKSPKICCIYKLTNEVNGKIYVGQTTDFRKRMNAYKNVTKRDVAKYGKIARAINKYGFDNFKVDILKRCEPDELTDYENYYISKLKSSNSDIGYNQVVVNNANSNSSESRKRKSISHTGLKESSITKRKKSNMVIAIKPEEKLILICESAKIFGDFVNVTKDMVKNCLRQPSRCHGWRLYYDDYSKRQAIRDKMMNKCLIRDKGYIKTLDMLDKYEIEGVETIYTDFDIYRLDYDFIDTNGRPIPQFISDGATAFEIYIRENDENDWS